ncbi:MAG: PRC-barrel domain-containing protein [Gemmatimonadota bacterium]|jgi:hypothetical protein|nr:PRC-barrel domain-containing protein [Gemmatimonadota bacterium]
MDEHTDRVISLNQAEDFGVARGEPDVRGWEVFAADGCRIGCVDDLLVDTEAMKVRYLEVLFDGGRPEGRRHILVPIGYARLSVPERICVQGLDSRRMSLLPSYDDGRLDDAFAEELEVYFAAGEPIRPPENHSPPLRGASIEDRVDRWVDGDWGDDAER